MRAVLVILLSLVLAASPAAPAAALPTPTRYCFTHERDDGRPLPICIGLATYSADVCAAIARTAAIWRLPPDYFARLIWQESHFDANAVSPAGAQGIAQFMPSTGRLQGLANPYDPAEALYRSARYLQLLSQKFGNLGLAAAAYNGGENGLARFIAGTGSLAAETLDYVQIVTGLPVTDWLSPPAQPPDYALKPGTPFDAACLELAEKRTLTAFTPPTAIVRPYGVQLTEAFSAATARRAFARLQQRYTAILGDEDLMLVARRNPNFGRALRYRAEIGRDTRAEAQALCAQLRRAGGACAVVRN